MTDSPSTTIRPPPPDAPAVAPVTPLQATVRVVRVTGHAVVTVTSALLQLLDAVSPPPPR